MIYVGNSIERILYEKCHKNKICSSFSALSGSTDSNLYEPEKLINNIRHEVSLFRGLGHISICVGVLELFTYFFVKLCSDHLLENLKDQQTTLMLCQSQKNPKLLRISWEVDGSSVCLAESSTSQFYPKSQVSSVTP